jgi:transcriptional regulator with XRE-family HTH domain
VRLRSERKRRRMSREELATAAGISAAWLRDIEAGEKPSVEVKQSLRAALSRCPVHFEFGVKCDHVLPVPPDEELYAPEDSPTTTA